MTTVRNPVLTITPEEVYEWIRQKADAAGFRGRSLNLVQISVKNPFHGGALVHSEIPSLVVMVSSLPDSRAQ